MDQQVGTTPMGVPSGRAIAAMFARSAIRYSGVSGAVLMAARCHRP